MLFSSTIMALVGYFSENWSSTTTLLNFVLLKHRQGRIKNQKSMSKQTWLFPESLNFHQDTYVIRTFTATGWQEIISDPSIFSLSVFLTISNSFSTALCVSGLENKAIFRRKFSKCRQQYATYSSLVSNLLPPNIHKPAFSRKHRWL